ncbi:MAG TPA: hypothetical protein VFA09_27170 [Ktedonobacteraceae bacterium]|nr:hypothetical protein [Ktedonobacteraceae bacterium]
MQQVIQNGLQPPVAKAEGKSGTTYIHLDVDNNPRVTSIPPPDGYGACIRLISDSIILNITKHRCPIEQGKTIFATIVQIDL